MEACVYYPAAPLRSSAGSASARFRMLSPERSGSVLRRRTARPGAVPVQSQHLDGGSRDLLELHFGFLRPGMGRGSPSETCPHDGEPDQRGDEAGRVFQRLDLISDTQDDAPQKRQGTPYHEMDLRLARQVGAGERDLVEAVETQYGENQSHRRKYCLMTRRRAPWPQPEAESRRGHPHRSRREQEQRAPAARQSRGQAARTS